ncbi:hypothetical protein Cantr_06634 [Candida viswanathii]|uniref:Uncharacterized protein n=1 Tax=Candida viswanathii TaxID=5486 RepID=A0A367XW56_9ASCO|nr:hypothetical protein Cantr_06634 [Candida viswanathii]
MDPQSKAEIQHVSTQDQVFDYAKHIPVRTIPGGEERYSKNARLGVEIPIDPKQAREMFEFAQARKFTSVQWK